jgi:hypothetical protein
MTDPGDFVLASLDPPSVYDFFFIASKPHKKSSRKRTNTTSASKSTAHRSCITNRCAMTNTKRRSGSFTCHDRRRRWTKRPG